MKQNEFIKQNTLNGNIFEIFLELINKIKVFLEKFRVSHVLAQEASIKVDV